MLKLFHMLGWIIGNGPKGGPLPENYHSKRSKRKMKILFVCTGNTCRSPMAEGLFRHDMEARGFENIMCQSAGLSAAEGEHPAENAVAVCREIGVDISGHITRRFTPDEIDIWDVYFTMSKTHAYILAQAGVPAERIYVPHYIEDPFGGDLDTYRRCRDKLREELQGFQRFLGF